MSTTINYDGAILCGHADTEAVSSREARWPQSRLTWQLDADLPGISRDSLRDVIREAGRSWSAICGMQWVEGAGSQANVLITTQREGPGGVLADCQLPWPGITERDTLRLRLDIADAWALARNPPQDRVGVLHVLAHEIGHAMGIGHGPQGALMQATYSSRLFFPQSWDRVEAQDRFGKPAAGPAPAPTQPSEPSEPRRRRFDGQLLRRILERAAGEAGLDAGLIPGVADLDGPLGGVLDGLLTGDGVELMSVRFQGGRLVVKVLGREQSLGRVGQ